MADTAAKLTRADFSSDQEVRWCPGCGDYSILATMQRTLPSFGIAPENIVFVSGIGCSGRFPYYMNTYGLHGIHGRAPALATGLKLTRPELSVWLVTGDGDGLSIGGNHLLHLLRRNPDINVLLLNNRIYGLTKGQYSPTSEIGKVTKTSPQGSADQPVNPLAFALGAGASFVARVLDVDAKGLMQVLTAAHEHRGTAFIEIYQNCNIFNDGAFACISDKKTRGQNMLWLEHEKPMIYGANNENAIGINQQNLAKLAATDAQVIQHDKTSLTQAFMLAQLDYPDFPVPMGVIYQQQRPVYEQLTNPKPTTFKHSNKDLMNLLTSNATWEVK